MNVGRHGEYVVVAVGPGVMRIAQVALVKRSGHLGVVFFDGTRRDVPGVGSTVEAMGGTQELPYRGVVAHALAAVDPEPRLSGFLRALHQVGGMTRNDVSAAMRVTGGRFARLANATYLVTDDELTALVESLDIMSPAPGWLDRILVMRDRDQQAGVVGRARVSRRHREAQVADTPEVPQQGRIRVPAPEPVDAPEPADDTLRLTVGGVEVTGSVETMRALLGIRAGAVL